MESYFFFPATGYGENLAYCLKGKFFGYLEGIRFGITVSDGKLVSRNLLIINKITKINIIKITYSNFTSI